MYQDHELIAKIVAGNLHVFRQLVTTHERLVKHMVQRIIKDEDDQKDVCQEVFIKVYKNIKHFKQESKLSTWIAQIAYTTSLDYLKKNKLRERLSEQEKDVYRTNQPIGHPENELNKKELRTFILKSMDQLPTNYKLMVQLFHLDGYSDQEIVNMTGLTEGAVKSNLFRARKILKEKLRLLIE